MDPGTGWNAMPAGYFLVLKKMLFLICLCLRRQQLHGCVRHETFYLGDLKCKITDNN